MPHLLVTMMYFPFPHVFIFTERCSHSSRSMKNYYLAIIIASDGM